MTKKLETLKLFDYQTIGAKWLAAKKFALLADRQRLGKTVQSIHASDLVQASRILVVCRAVARVQWSTEFERWQKPIGRRSITISKGNQLNRYGVKTHLNPPPMSVTIVSYEGLHNVMAGLINNFDLVIVDESHYLKTPSARRTQEVLGKSGLLHCTERIWFLSGTPAPNHAAELWTLLYTSGTTKIPYQTFIKRYCNVFESGYGQQILGTKTDATTLLELKTLLNKIMLRRTESDVSIELPSISYSKQVVERGHVNILEAGLFDEELKKYGENGLRQKLKEELSLLESIVDGVASHEMIEVLKAQAQSVSTLRKYTALQKIDSLCEIINEELKEKAYEKVVIFCVHRSAVKTLTTRLREFNPVSVVGGTTNAAENIAKFQDPNSNCKIFIGNINAAGTSISLMAANHIYFLEESWVPGDNAQAAMRCGGVNQKKPIFVRTVILNNSVDSKVSEVLNRKTVELTKLIETELI